MPSDMDSLDKNHDFKTLNRKHTQHIPPRTPTLLSPVSGFVGIRSQLQSTHAAKKNAPYALFFLAMV